MSHRATLEFHDYVVTLAESLRPLPTTLSRLASIIADESSEVHDVAAVLRQDPSLVAGLLREANSAAASPASIVGTLEGTIVRLGFARVLAMATNLALRGVADVALESYGLSQSMNERYTLAVSFAAEAIYAESPLNVGPEAVTAAIVHDIGQIVMDELLDPDHFNEARGRHLLITSAERELVDVDHAELGALLLDLWGVPDSVVDGVRHHHEPQRSSGLTAHVVFVADQMASELIDGHPPIDPDPELEDMVTDSLALLEVDRRTIAERAFWLYHRAR